MLEVGSRRMACPTRRTPRPARIFMATSRREGSGRTVPTCPAAVRRHVRPIMVTARHPVSPTQPYRAVHRADARCPRCWSGRANGSTRPSPLLTDPISSACTPSTVAIAPARRLGARCGPFGSRLRRPSPPAFERSRQRPLADPARARATMGAHEVSIRCRSARGVSRVGALAPSSSSRRSACPAHRRRCCASHRPGRVVVVVCACNPTPSLPLRDRQEPACSSAVYDPLSSPPASLDRRGEIDVTR